MKKQLMPVVQKPEIESEKLWPILDAVEKATGVKRNVTTIYRWYTKGNRDGVKLETKILGSTRMTSVEAVLRFVERATYARNGKLESE